MEELPDSEVFEGLRAMPPREIVEALHAWDCDPDLSVLVGAVTTLARTVEEQHTEIAKLNAMLVAVARVVDDVRGYVELQRASTREFNASRAEGRPFDEGRVYGEATERSPMGLIERYAPSEAAAWRRAEPANPAPADHLELVYLGLVDIWRMARPVVNDQREDIGNITRLHERTTALVAIEARCRAMLEAAGKLPPN